VMIPLTTKFLFKKIGTAFSR